MSEYQILVTKSAQKQLMALPLEVISRIEVKVNALSNNPRPPDCRKLKGRKNRWRIRVGDYRVIYSIDDLTLTLKVLNIGHRRDIYEQ